MLEYALLFCPSAERVCEANGQIGYERKQSWYPSCLAIVIPEEPLFGLFALLLRVDRAPRENLGSEAEISRRGQLRPARSPNASCTHSGNIAVLFSNSATYYNAFGQFSWRTWTTFPERHHRRSENIAIATYVVGPCHRMSARLPKPLCGLKIFPRIGFCGREDRRTHWTAIPESTVRLFGEHAIGSRKISEYVQDMSSSRQAPALDETHRLSSRRWTAFPESLVRLFGELLSGSRMRSDERNYHPFGYLADDSRGRIEQRSPDR